MDASKNLSANDLDHGKYIIVKIPRNLVTENLFNILSIDQKYQSAFHIVLCIVTFLLGIILGSVFHDRLLNSNFTQPVWKSSNFMQSDGK